MRLSISAVVAVVLLVLLVTATPAQFPGLVGAQSIEENAGGGDDVNPDFGAVNATVAADNGPGSRCSKSSTVAVASTSIFSGA